MKRILIVDGYNVINARRRVGNAPALADERHGLVRELQDYAGFSGQRIVVVFDAWQSESRLRSVEEHGAVRVVYTRRGETADHYIERLCDGYEEEIRYRRAEVRVATSDALEQTIVLGRGAIRISARELLLEMGRERAAGMSGRPEKPAKSRSCLQDRLSPELVRRMREAAWEE